MSNDYSVRDSSLTVALTRIAGRGRHTDGGTGELELSAGALRRRFSREFQPQPALYWVDMLGSAVLGWASFALAASLPVFSLLGMAAMLVAVLALYRAVLFIHELTHLRSGAVRGFETVWNLLVGLPLMVPSLMYVSSHNEHHKRAVYGTDDDPEYDFIAHWSPVRIISSVLTMLAVPGLLMLRWGVLGPLSLLSSRLRDEVVGRASTLVINPRYRRPRPEGAAKTRWALQELGGALLFWSAMAGLATGVIEVAWMVRWYGIGVGVLLLNHVRTLAAHQYENEGAEMNELSQLVDSVNVLGPPWLTALAAPVGLRYHALHHFLPSLPYHGLGAVHRGMVAELAPDSPYHRTQSRGILSTLSDLLTRSAGHRNERRGRAEPGVVRVPPETPDAGRNVSTPGRFSREPGTRAGEIR